MISVIVPVYKAEKTIARCIESVIAQEYKDWELILVDDGSPDRSGEICDEYAKKDERIRVIHQENAGASAARNHGIDEASGEYICFIDADDYVTARYLSSFKINDECDFEIQGFCLQYPDSSRNATRVPKCEGIFPVVEMLDLPSLWYLIKGPYCKLYRQSILMQHHVRFPQEFSYGEDEIFVLSYLQSCTKSVAVLPVCNYYYTHETEGSLSRSFVPGMKLQATVRQQYDLLCDIEERIGSIPVRFLEFYRKDRALDFYQSRYNCLVDMHNNLFVRCLQFLSYDNLIWQFVKGVTDLPDRFTIIRRFICLISFFKPNKR